MLAPEPRTLSGPNPLKVPAEADYLQPVQRDVPHYSETMYFSVCNRSDDGVGLFLHMGRMPDDLDMWWSRTIAYLPDSQVAIARTFGRAKDRTGPATGNFSARCTEPLRRWQLNFDGAAELTTHAATGSGLVGEGAATPLGFDIECVALGPVWDLEAACGLDADVDYAELGWAKRHQQQGFIARGSITIGGRNFVIDGVAYRDHSWGPRDVTNFGEDAFIGLVFPDSGRVVGGLQVWDRTGVNNLRSFYVTQGDTLEVFGDGAAQRGVDTHSNPRAGLQLTMRRESGEELCLQGRVLNGAAITILDPNQNLNGAILDRSDALVLNEDLVSYVWPDGDVAYGHSERGLRPVR